MPFRFERLEIPEVVLVEPKAFDDPRGFFIETYRRSQFETNGIPDAFVQDNHSHSIQGVLRGLHFQKHPKAQAKLIMAVRGEIYDVAADIRRGTPDLPPVGRLERQKIFHIETRTRGKVMLTHSNPFHINAKSIFDRTISGDMNIADTLTGLQVGRCSLLRPAKTPLIMFMPVPAWTQLMIEPSLIEVDTRYKVIHFFQAAGLIPLVKPAIA